MRLIPLFLLLSIWVTAQKVSTTAFGDIQMTLSDWQVNQLVKDKLLVLDVSEPEMPNQNIQVNGVDYHIIYFKNLRTKKLSIMYVSSESTKLKTLSGIGIGSSVNELWQKYKNYHIAYASNGGNEKTFTLYDHDHQTELQFIVKNQKVTKITLFNYGQWMDDYINYSEND